MNVFRLAQFIDSLHILLLHVGPYEESAVIEQTFGAKCTASSLVRFVIKVNNE